jgi:hypothetical protein
MGTDGEELDDVWYILLRGYSPKVILGSDPS